jgi:HSP20 family molecular chaperone IbpA
MKSIKDKFATLVSNCTVRSESYNTPRLDSESHNPFNDLYTSSINVPYVGDFPQQQISTADKVISSPNTGGLNGWRPWNGDVTVGGPGAPVISDLDMYENTAGWFFKDQNGKMSKLEMDSTSVPNKVDKELVDCKFPYNIKKDHRGNLIYDFAVAGYAADRILLQRTKNGINVILSEQEEEDDLIGEDYEFLCKGIKDSKIEESIYIDDDLFDTDNYTADLDNGILSIFIPVKVGSLYFKNVVSKSKKVNIK